METNTVVPVAPMTTPAVPSSYAKLGVKSGYDPTPPTDLNFFIIGPSGEGKTTFVSSIPKTLILSFEKKGANGIPNSRAHRIPVGDRATLDAVFAQLEADAKNPARPYTRVCFDTIDQMVEMMNPEIAAEYRAKTRWTGDDITEFGEKGAGWAKLKSGCWEYFQRLEKAGYSWVCIGHVTEKTITINNQERTVSRVVLFDSFAKLITRNADVLATLYSVVEQEATEITYNGKKLPGPMTDVVKVYMDMTTMPTEKNTTLGKIRNVPMMTSRLTLPAPLSGKFGWDEFLDSYTSAVEKVKAQLANK